MVSYNYYEYVNMFGRYIGRSRAIGWEVLDRITKSWRNLEVAKRATIGILQLGPRYSSFILWIFFFIQNMPHRLQFLGLFGYWYMKKVVLCIQAKF